MSAKTDTQTSKLDFAKLFSAAMLVTIAIIAFYYFADHSLLLRVVGLLVVIGIAVGIFLTTELGGNLIGFTHEARGELRKVVWPTRTETIQTSLAVIFMVIIMGIFLWLLDMFLFWLVRLLTA
jgi:preprotein translocase subunit SecE